MFRMEDDEAGGWNNDPFRGSLGLLPSGPDPVGEWIVHHQPPKSHIGNPLMKCKRFASRSNDDIDRVCIQSGE
jgi:hypothetical protein